MAEPPREPDFQDETGALRDRRSAAAGPVLTRELHDDEQQDQGDQDDPENVDRLGVPVRQGDDDENQVRQDRTEPTDGASDGWFAIVPLALGALFTGLVMALGTAWGLFRHYWVLFKLPLTCLATIVLLMHMPRVSSMAGVAAEPVAPSAHLDALPGEILHAGGGLLALLATPILSVYKPRGVTPYGWRKQSEQPTVAQ